MSKFLKSFSAYSLTKQKPTGRTHTNKLFGLPTHEDFRGLGAQRWRPEASGAGRLPARLHRHRLTRWGLSLCRWALQLNLLSYRSSQMRTGLKLLTFLSGPFPKLTFRRAGGHSPLPPHITLRQTEGRRGRWLSWLESKLLTTRLPV